MRADTRRTPTLPPTLAVLLLAACLALAAGCRQGLYDQAKYEPYEASPLFADGTSARPLPAHTIPRGHLREDLGYYTGRDEAGQFVPDFPMEITREVLARGEQRFNIFCSPCHGRTGAGNGMIVQRGFRKRPETFLQERVAGMAPGYFVNVMTEGFGVMPRYASQVPPEDRWAIAAWIRVLQAARNVPFETLAEDQRQTLDRLPVRRGETTGEPEEPPTTATPEVPQ